MPAFRTDVYDGFLVRRQDTVAAADAQLALFPDPDILLLSGVICKPGSRTHGALVEINGRRYFLKRYNCRGWLYRLQNVVRRSRAVYTWQLAWSFLQRGVPVPEPVLCLEERFWRLLGRSYVLMAVADGERLVDVWPTLTKERQAVILARIGRLLGNMHRQGCLHGDLKWGNILLDERFSEPKITLVDLDGGRQLYFPFRLLASRDLLRFLKDLRRIGGDQSLEQIVYNSWRAGWEGRADAQQ